MLVALAITEKANADGSKKSFWTKVGVAFKNKDDSITVRLDAFPISGTLQIREAQEKPVEAGQGPSHTTTEVPF